MPAQDLQTIAALVGKSGDAAFMSLLRTFQQQNAYAAGIHPRLPYLYTYRDAVKALMGASAAKIDWTGPGGVTQHDSQEFKAWEALLKSLETDIELTTKLGAVSYLGVATGTLTTTAPEQSSAGFPDPNSSAFRGDPLNRCNR